MILCTESNWENYTTCIFRNLIIRSIYFVKWPVINFTEDVKESKLCTLCSDSDLDIKSTRLERAGLSKIGSVLAEWRVVVKEAAGRGERGLSFLRISRARSRQLQPRHSPAWRTLRSLTRSWPVHLAGAVPFFLCLWSPKGYEEGFSMLGERQSMRDACNYMAIQLFFSRNANWQLLIQHKPLCVSSPPSAVVALFSAYLWQNCLFLHPAKLPGQLIPLVPLLDSVTRLLRRRDLEVWMLTKLPSHWHFGLAPQKSLLILTKKPNKVRFEETVICFVRWWDKIRLLAGCGNCIPKFTAVDSFHTADVWNLFLSHNEKCLGTGEKNLQPVLTLWKVKRKTQLI